MELLNDEEFDKLLGGYRNSAERDFTIELETCPHITFDEEVLVGVQDTTTPLMHDPVWWLDMGEGRLGCIFQVIESSPEGALKLGLDQFKEVLSENGIDPEGLVSYVASYDDIVLTGDIGD
jgi:hypothetical protein